MASTTIPLSIAISTNPGIKHWSLFIEGATDDEKIFIQLFGARYHYFLNIATRSDARNSSSLVELIHLCRVEVSKVESIQNIAENMVIRNDVVDYSCQDFVIQLLDTLEEDGIINPDDDGYAKGKENVRQKRESWQ